MLTTFGQDEHVYKALRAGASGFLLKDAPRTQLIHAVRAVAAGDEMLAPAITRRLIERFMGSHANGGSAGLLSELSDREVDVLKLMARGLSNAEIAATLIISTSTVKTHVEHILQKLRVRDRVQAVVIAHESGIMAPHDET